MIKHKLIFLVTSGIAFSAHAQSSHTTSCVCASCSLASQNNESEIGLFVNDSTYSTGNGHLLLRRWSATATNGSGLQMGDATTLTWGLVANGTPIAANIGGVESTDPSSLIAFLDSSFGNNGGGSNLTTRPWFNIFANSYNRWGEISGLSFVYEPNDGGAAIDGSNAPLGTLGTYADLRIGGHSIDGQGGSNTLAYNFFPNHGDMVIDTDNTNFFGVGNSANDYRGFRNVVMHEAGHGLGMNHPVSSNRNFLMEPFIDTSFDGPQHSDILAVHRGYGDVLEKGGGNDSAATATALGAVASFSGIGFDGDNAVVARTDVDFVSIDGLTDTDFYSITLAEEGTLDIYLDALGLQYQIQEQSGANPVNVDTSALNNLALALFNSDGSTLLASSNANGLGGSESIIGQFLSANTYFIRVTGGNDAAQFYSLTTTFLPSGIGPVIPEPSNLALLAVSFAGLLIRRRR